MTRPGELGAEARQLRLLWRDSVRRLLDTIAASRDADPWAFVLWATVLAVTLPLLYSMRRILVYQFLSRQAPALIDATVRRDRLFFIVYGMLASALLAVVVWDAMFPDSTDQEIIGALPVRPRTAALARMGAAISVCLALTAAINVPAGLFYGLATTTFNGFQALPRLLAGHVVATLGAGVFVFLVLMTARGLIAITCGQRTADRLALGLQTVTIVSIVEGLLFLPGALARAHTGAEVPTLPPLWYLATYDWIAGGSGTPWRHALVGPLAALTVLALLVAVSLGPAGLMGRRALQTRGRMRASRGKTVIRAIALVVSRSAAVRAMFEFAVASLFRSRRHLLLLSARLGIATALSLTGILLMRGQGGLVFDRPRGYWLAPPLIFLYFLVFGSRSCLAIATDLDANWVFRLNEPSASATRAASRLVLLLVAVAPVALVALALAAAFWHTGDALRFAAIITITGMAMSDLALRTWTNVPFATAHPPDPNAVKAAGPRAVIQVIVVALILPVFLTPVTGSTMATAVYTAVVTAAALWMRRRNERELRSRPPTFEPDDNEVLTLQLSEAGH